MENAVSSLTEVMSVISNALLLPVLVAVLFCLGWVLVSAGGFFREWAGRRSRRRALAGLVSAGDDSALGPADLWKRLQTAPHPVAAFLVKGLPTLPPSPEPVRKRLTDLESATADSLARLSFLTRVGPMLGLLGTLIPLGPALTGLSAGNAQQLSGNLVVAFTATVVGLVVSCLAYGMGLVRRSWYGRDLDDLDYLVARLYPGGPVYASEAKVGP
jgi:biopolymer transport protein ExbB/TolQ